MLRTDDDLARLVTECIEDAAASGAVWIELAFHPAHHRERFGTDQQIVEVVLAAMAGAGASTGVGSGLMLSADRTKDPADAVELAELAAALRRTRGGVVRAGQRRGDRPARSPTPRPTPSPGPPGC